MLTPTAPGEVIAGGAHVRQAGKLSVAKVALPAGAMPLSISAGADGRLWFDAGPSLGAIRPGSPPVFFAPPAGLEVGDVVAGGDGAIWMLAEGRLQRIRTDGTWTGLDQSFHRKSSLARGAGGDMWVSSVARDAIYIVSATADPARLTGHSASALALGPDGLIWGLADGVFAVDRGGISHFEMPIGSGVLGSPVWSTTGELWFTDLQVHGEARIDRLDAAGNVTRFLLRGYSPAALIASGRGGVWALLASDDARSVLGHMARDGMLDLYQVDFDGGLIAAGAIGGDGRLWVVDNLRSRLFAVAI